MLSDNIRKYRKLNNMSQDELAEKLGVTRQSISLWETGQTQPSLENIVALAKLFEISTDELLVSDKTEPPASNTVADQLPNNPKNKAKIPFLVLGIVIAAVVLATVALVLLGKNNDSKKGPDTTNPQTTAATTANNAPETTPDKTEAGTNNPQTPTATTASKPSEATPVETGSDSKNPQTSAATTANKTPETTPSETEKDIFGYLKKFVIEKGTVNGDYCYYSKPADNYGGYASENFSLYYWGDTNKIEFCLHSVLNETFSINFYLYVPEEHSGKYEYISSYYYRDTGEPLYEARGTITAKEFTDKYPLNCTKYFGSTENQNTFMEISRQGVCDLIGCLEKFIEVENIKYSFEDFGFLKFQLNRS